MIPTIETIVEGLLAGNYTSAQAVGWLYMHAEDAGSDLRDHFATSAMQGILANWQCEFHPVAVSNRAYVIADAMLQARTE